MGMKPNGIVECANAYFASIYNLPSVEINFREREYHIYVWIYLYTLQMQK